MKKLLFFSLAVLMTVMASAKPVNPDRAVQVARNFVAQYVKGAENFAATVVYTHPMPKSHQPAMYVVNVGNTFVIVSADDIAHPVLGYSLSRPWPVQTENGKRANENSTDANVMLPSQVSGYLDDLAAQIESAAGQQGTLDRETASEWRQLLSLNSQLLTTNLPDSVGPLLTTTWDQGLYYNALCPADVNGPDGHVPTGCVATAMAQIINYWGYPVHGRGIHSYQSNYGILTVNYDSATYDYANMPDALTATSTPAQVNAVATLMRDCGVAANMVYGSAYGSYTTTISAGVGLINFFQFNPYLGYIEKVNFSDSAWNSLLRENIAANRPVYYAGLSYDVGGHAFVCDGYKTNDFFHFNFGWSGYADGWYLTSAVTIDGINFNSEQEAIVGIFPDSISNVVVSEGCNGTTFAASTFIIAEPMDFVLYGNMPNRDSRITSVSGTGGLTSFIPADTTKQIVLDYITPGSSETGIMIYDGVGRGSLIQFVYFTPYADYDPIVSTLHAMSVYSNGHGAEGYRIHLSMDGGCRMVSGINAFVDTATVRLSWNENGTSSEWDVEYGLQGFVQGEGTLVRVDTNVIEIDSLIRPNFYDIYIRPTCNSAWKKHTVYAVNYWADDVTHQPEGYMIDSNGVVCISSAEELAWWARLASEGNIYRNVRITSDIDLAGKLWRTIPQYQGSIDGEGHVIRNMTIYEPNNGGAFIGMFSGGSIKNLGLEDYNIRGFQDLAGLVNYCYGSVLNCWAKNGYLEGNSIGGLIGTSFEPVQNCYALGIHANGRGYNSGLINYAVGMVRNCYSFSLAEEHGWISMSGVAATSSNADIDHCYCGDIPENIYQGIVGSAYTTCIRDTSVIIETNGILTLRDSVMIDTSYYDNLLEALNQFVITNGDSTWRMWTVNEGDLFPVFGEFKEDSCATVSGVSVKNEVIDNQASIKICWQPSSSNYDIICYFVDSVDKAPVMYHVSDTCLILNNLILRETYKFSVRAVCDSNNRSAWSTPIRHTFDKPYWHEVVTSQPEGFIMEGNVIAISSAEGLTWLARGLNSMEPDALSIGDGNGYTVNIVADIDLSMYKWEPIIRFSGVINGHNHHISNLYSQVGLFEYLNGATVKNLNIDGNVYGLLIVPGGLFSYASYATIFNCHSAVNVHSVTGSTMGSLGGSAYFSQIVNCSSSGNVVSNDVCGGLVGEISENCSVKNCYSRSIVQVADDNQQSLWRGGLLGIVSAASVENAYACGSAPYANQSSFASTIGLLMDASSAHYIYGLVNPDYPWVPICNTNTGNLEELYNCSFFGGDGHLNDSVSINNVYYDTLLSALNAWVDANNTEGIYFHWVRDSVNENGGFPVFATQQSYSMTLMVDENTPYGSVYGGGTYSVFDSNAVFFASPQEGYHFLQWNDGNTDNPRTVELTQDTSFTAQFGINTYSIVGTANIEVSNEYDFENPAQDYMWTIQNGSFVNRWYIGTLDDANRALFISNDNGISNDYTEDEASYVFACLPMSLKSGEFYYSYDWRCNAESNFDYLRVALVPTSLYLNIYEWGAFSLPSDAIALDGGEMLVNQRTWITQSGMVNVPANGNYWMVFYWKNDYSVKHTPPAAIDNIQFQNYHTQEDIGVVLGSDTVQYLDTVTLTAIPGEGYRFVQWNDGNTENPRIIVATENMRYRALFECIPMVIDDSVVVCDSYSWNGTVYTSSIVLTDSLSTITGCDSIMTHHLIVNHSTTIIETVTECDSYFFGGQWLYASGQYTDTLANAANCDSIVTLNLTINNPVHTAVTELACDSYTWQGATLTVSGDYTYPHDDVNGCTQVDTLHLIINHDTVATEAVTECDNYFFGGQWVYASGQYMDTLTSAAGCDSIVTLNLTINNPVHTAVTELACDSYTWQEATLTVSGDYTYPHDDVNGCTQVDTLHLTVNYSNTGVETVTACDSYTWHGTAYTASNNTATFTETNAANCDSVVTLNLTINYSNTGVETVTACDSYTWHGTAYTASNNTATFTETNAANCDSVVTLNLTINYSNTGVETVTACDSYTWHGTAYTASNNTATFTETNAANCDSVVTLNLTVNYSNTGDTVAVACEGFEWQGTTYTVSGVVHGSMPLQNAAGCDSVVTLHLTINNPIHTATMEVACDSLFWSGQWLTVGGQYTDAHPDANGCTQVDTLYLTVNHSATTTVTDTAEGSYTWNGTIYTESGTYQWHGTTAEGCDSTVTLMLVINHVGIGEIDNSKMNIDVYPNPTTGQLTIDAEGILSVEVFESTGRKVATHERTNNIDLAKFPTGTYLLKIHLPSGTSLQRVILK